MLAFIGGTKIVISKICQNIVQKNPKTGEKQAKILSNILEKYFWGLIKNMKQNKLLVYKHFQPNSNSSKTGPKAVKTTKLAKTFPVLSSLA